MNIESIVEKALKKAGVKASVAAETDNFGQIVLYTGLIEDEDGIRPMTDADFEECE